MASNSALWRQAQHVLAGGVNSPVRAFRAVGGIPRFIESGRGPYLTDVSGRRYVDFIMGWGAHILGHRPPAVVRAIQRQLQRGTIYGLPTTLETDLARLICQAIPSIERIRFVSSGTEACMSAIRLARGVTQRTKILKFEGCYHGHADSFLVKAGSGLATFGMSSSAGVPPALARDTIVAPFNDLKAVERAFRRFPRQMAAVIVEPVAANMGVIPPAPEFLPGLRRLATRYGALLIFDEVITGFRLTYGGYQQLVEVRPDLTILGKIIGGGLPCGAFGGRAALMRRLAPEGDVYQAGTLSGHPLAMAAGIAVLKELKRTKPYAQLAHRTERFYAELLHSAATRRATLAIARVGSMFTWFCLPKPPSNWAEARQADTKRYAVLFRACLDAGVLLPPSQFEACFLSTAHTESSLTNSCSGLRL